MVDTIRKMLKENPNYQKVLDYLCDSWSGKADKGLFLWGCGNKLGLTYDEIDEALRYLHGGGIIEYEPYRYGNQWHSDIKVVQKEYVSSQAKKIRPVP